MGNPQRREKRENADALGALPCAPCADENNLRNVDVLALCMERGRPRASENKRFFARLFFPEIPPVEAQGSKNEPPGPQVGPAECAERLNKNVRLLPKKKSRLLVAGGLHHGLKKA